MYSVQGYQRHSINKTESGYFLIGDPDNKKSMQVNSFGQ